jgi:hypothetical protein
MDNTPEVISGGRKAVKLSYILKRFEQTWAHSPHLRAPLLSLPRYCPTSLKSALAATYGRPCACATGAQVTFPR